MKLRITAICDRGCVRSSNEDMVLVGRKLLRDGRLQGSLDLDEENRVFVVAVADGMGGANAGEVASEMVLESMSKGVLELPGSLNEDALKGAVRSLCIDTHQRVLAESSTDENLQGMGSTLICMLYYEGRLLLINAGDSRLYRFRNGTLMQLSTDHSLRNLPGHADAPSNVITNSFGGSANFYVDIEPAGKKVLDGDLYLLCSDGLSGTLPDEELEQILSLEGFEDELLAASKRKLVDDNVSYVLVEVSDAA